MRWLDSVRSGILPLTAALSAAAGACTLGDLFSPQVPNDLTVEITADSLLVVGDTVTLVTRLLADGEPVGRGRLVYTSTRPGVATVDDEGRVAVLQRDTFSIHVEARSGSLASDPPTATEAFRGIADRITASPDTMFLTSIGATYRLLVSALTKQGVPIPDVPILWRSDSAASVSVDASGVITALSNGEPVNVIAEADHRADTVSVWVRQRTATITIDPAGATLRAAGDTVGFTAEIRDSLGQLNTVSDVNWSTTSVSVLTVDATGFAAAVGEGISGVIAESNGVADTARVIVSRLMQSLEVTPGLDTLIAIHDTVRLSASGTDQSGNPVPLPVVEWRSLNEEVATVDTAGVVTAGDNGDAYIVAASGGVEDTVTVTVSQVVASVEIISPAYERTLTSLRDSVAFIARALDRNGFVIAGTGFTWSSDDSTVVTVDQDGVVIAEGNGYATINASAGGFNGGRGVTVEQAVASVNVWPDRISLANSEKGVQLNAGAYDNRGFDVAGVGFMWEIRDWGVVSTDGSGWLYPGPVDDSTYVLATAYGFSDSALVRVGPLSSVCTDGTPHESDITSDETWTAADSPHCVGRIVNVYGNAVLSIEAGATVEFTSGAGLRFGNAGTSQSAELRAEGSAGSPIIFTPFNNTGQRGQWDGIVVDWLGSGDSLVLRNTILEYAGAGGSATIRNDNRCEGAVVLDGVTIREGSWDGINLQGPWSTNCELSINLSIIENNSGSGVVLGDGPASITGTQIRNNGGNGIDASSFGGAMNVVVTKTVVKNNVIADNGGIGVVINNGGTFSGNRIRGNNYPLEISGAVLGGLAGQDIDSLLGNTHDTLIIQCCWDARISATDTVRTSPRLPWRVDANELEFADSTIWKIEAGATIISNSNTYYTFNGGALRADGDTARIVFTTGQIGGGWGHLVFHSPTDTSLLRNVEFRFGGNGTDATLKIESSVTQPVILDTVRVTRSQSNGIQVRGPTIITGPVVADSNSWDGMQVEVRDVTLSDSRFAANGGNGIYSSNAATGLTVVRSQLVGNGNWGADLHGDNTTVEYSNIAGNSNGGLHIEQNSPRVRGDTIQSNTGDGLDLWNSSNSVVQDNLIADNSGAGARMQNNAAVSGNRIRGNRYPLEISPDVLGALTSQNIESLLGNTGDTLFIDCCGSVAATDTVRTTSALPWVVQTSIDFVGTTVWKIEPGATVLMDGGSLNVNGRALIADGEDQGIVITGRNKTRGSWGSLRLGSTTDSSLLRNLEVRYGGGSGSSAALNVEWDGSHAVVLDSVRVLQSLSAGIRIDGPTVVRRYLAADSNSASGLLAQWGGLTVPAGSFSDNGGWGVEVRGWDFSLVNAEVSTNGVGGSSGGIGIYAGRSTITDTRIHDNSAQGIYVAQNGSNHTFARDTIERNGSYGVELRAGSVSFTDNIVRNNTGDGIFGDAGDSQVFTALSGNTVTGNGGYPIVLDPLSLAPFAGQNQRDLLGNTKDTLCICSGWSVSDRANVRGSVTVESYLPWRVNRFLTVGNGATLTANAGATVVMDSAGAGLWIGATVSEWQLGRILALGTAANPVRFIAADTTKPWHVLAIVNQSESSVLRHTLIEYGGNSTQAGALDIADVVQNRSVVLDTVTIRRASNHGVAVSSPAVVNGLSALDNDSSGILLRVGTLAIAINGSRLERNGEAGIRVDGGSGHTVSASILAANVRWGLLNNTSITVDAIANWWGFDTGPLHSTTNPDGNGNPVSDLVLFDPPLPAIPQVP